MNCAVCGTVLVPGARFCWNCGAPQDATAMEDAERRRVTVLFGDLSEFTSWAEDLDPERVGVVTDRVLAALADVVTGVGGHVDKLTGDGIMAVFGAPTAHEDDPERAVRAAAAMQQAVGRLVADESGGGQRLGLRVGLNTGEVLAGVQGHLSYTVVGDTVNTASRLSDAAGVGAVFAGRDTAVATMQSASWRALRPLRLKGKRAPVEAYELVGLRPGDSAGLGVGDEAPLVGREAEMGALRGRFRSVVEQGAPATVILSGDAGVGKTRLAKELARIAGERSGARVLWGHCLPYGLGRDFAPFAEMVRTACGIEPDNAPEEIRARVARAVARLEHPAYRGWVPTALTERLLVLLGEAAGNGEPGSDLPYDRLTPGPRPDQPEIEALVALLTGLAAQAPLILIVDDLHFARPSLLRGLSDLGRQLRGPILSIGLTRPGLLDEHRSGALRDLPNPELLPVEPLDAGASSRLLRAYLGGGTLAPDVRDALVTRAQGNPFFLGELLHLLVDRGLLQVGEDGTWALTGEIPPEDLPDGVRAVLAARIDSFDVTSRALLRDAAVLGTSFPAAALPALDPRVDAASVTPLLDAMVGKGILTAVGGGRYTFAHTLARDVAYAGLPKGERARRHAAAAHWAADHMTGPRGDVDAVLAVQADRAVRLAQEMSLGSGDPAWSAGMLGLLAAIRLGQEALNRDDHAAAEVHLLRAERLVAALDPPAPQRLAVQVAYAEAMAGQRRLDEAEASLEAPLAADLPALRAAALVVQGGVHYKRGDYAGARTAYEQAFTLAGKEGLDGLLGVAIRELGMLDYFEGRLVSAEDRFRQALELARRVRDARGAGWALQHLAWSATTRGEYAVADAALAEAGEVFIGLQDTGGLAWCAGTEAMVRMLQGRLRESRDMVQGLLPTASALGGAGWEVAACVTVDAICAVDLGDLDAAEARIHDAIARFTVLGDSWGTALALIAEGGLARARGRTRDAVRSLRRATQLAADGHHRPLELLARVLLGLVHLDRRDVKAAAGEAQQADEIASHQDVLADALVGLWVLKARIARERGHSEDAEALLQRCVNSDVPNFLFPLRQAYAHLAGTYLQRGDVARAADFVDKAVATPAEDVRSRIVTQRVLAEVRARQGEEQAAADAVREALRIGAEFGFEGEAPATRRLASRLHIEATA